MSTGEDIRAVRRRLAETQAEFASRFGVDQTTIHRWETYGLPERGTARIAVDSLLTDLETKAAAQ